MNNPINIYIYIYTYVHMSGGRNLLTRYGDRLLSLQDIMGAMSGDEAMELKRSVLVLHCL